MQNKRNIFQILGNCLSVGQGEEHFREGLLSQWEEMQGVW